MCLPDSINITQLKYTTVNIDESGENLNDEINVIETAKNKYNSNVVLSIPKDNGYMIGTEEAISIDNKDVIKIGANVKEDTLSISNDSFETKVKVKVENNVDQILQLQAHITRLSNMLSPEVTLTPEVTQLQTFEMYKPFKMIQSKFVI